MPGGPLLTICSVSGKDMGQQVPPHAFTCLYRTATRTATLAQDLRGVSQPISSRARIWSQVPLRPRGRELNVMDENLGSGARASGLGFGRITDLLTKEMGAPPDSKDKVTATHEERPAIPPGGIKNMRFKVRPPPPGLSPCTVKSLHLPRDHGQVT